MPTLERKHRKEVVVRRTRREKGDESSARVLIKLILIILARQKSILASESPHLLFYSCFPTARSLLGGNSLIFLWILRKKNEQGRPFLFRGKISLMGIRILPKKCSQISLSFIIFLRKEGKIMRDKSRQHLTLISLVESQYHEGIRRNNDRKAVWKTVAGSTERTERGRL